MEDVRGVMGELEEAEMGEPAGAGAEGDWRIESMEKAVAATLRIENIVNVFHKTQA